MKVKVSFVVFFCVCKERKDENQIRQKEIHIVFRIPVCSNDSGYAFHAYLILIKNYQSRHFHICRHIGQNADNTFSTYNFSNGINFD